MLPTIVGFEALINDIYRDVSLTQQFRWLFKDNPTRYTFNQGNTTSRTVEVFITWVSQAPAVVENYAKQLLSRRYRFSHDRKIYRGQQ